MDRVRHGLDGYGKSRYNFFCPGCKEVHSVNDGWTFNGKLDFPTFSPSVLVQSGHFCPRHKKGDRCWCTYHAENPGSDVSFHCYRCHSYVRDGQIQFLGDCSHDLKNQTVDLPDIEHWHT